jgi:choline dehydrogenase-like flavoprotein
LRRKERVEELETDVVVIGSGAGGAVVAKELSSAGHRVAIIEEGYYFKRDHFRLNPVESFRTMYRQGGTTIALGAPFITLPLGRTVGGTTTINSGTCLRMPHRVLKRWHVELGLGSIDWEELNLIYGAIEEYLFVKRADPEVAGRNAKLFLETAERLGLSGGWLPRNAKDCEGYGVCVFGCPSGAKQSMDVSYIPDALAAGAVLHSRSRAERIIVEDGRATGVEARRLGAPLAGEDRLRVNARAVVLAAGAIYTPYLLLAQGICNSSGMVGRNLHIHPATGVIAELGERLDNPKGIPQSSYVDEFEAEGVMLEGGTVPPGVHAMALPFCGRRHRAHMNSYPYTGIFGAMISEKKSEGRVLCPPGARRPIILYQLRGEDVERTRFATALLAHIWFAAGAKKVYTPIYGFYEISNSRELAGLERARIRPSDIAYMSAYHPMGTCRMGTSPEDSVVKDTCETWDVRNLYIVDGSIIPSSLGVNPQLTIMAMATRAAGFIDEHLGGSKAELSARGFDRSDSRGL